MKTLYLIYHEIRPAKSRYSYAVSCPEFEQHCELFSKLQREPVAADRLRPELTFDDGHRSAVEYALPILQQHGLHAHFFITAGWTGRKNGYMSAPDLVELENAGMSIGAHGWSHKLLTHCDETELHRELEDTKAALEDMLGKPIQTLSLPGGRANARVLRACTAAGYTRVFTSAPSISGEPNGRTIGRLNLRGDASAAWIDRLLQPETGTLTRLQRIDQVKSAAKTVLGDRLYANLWSLANHEESDPADAGAHA